MICISYHYILFLTDWLKYSDIINNKMRTLRCRSQRNQNRMRLFCTKKRKQQRAKRKNQQKRIKRHSQKTKRTQRKGGRIQRQVNKGGNIMPNPAFNKIKSIGYEFESPNLIPFHFNPSSASFNQIKPVSMYDIYFEQEINKDTNFKVITDDDMTYINAQIRNAKDYVYINRKNDPNKFPLIGKENAKILGHTEFLTTFYKPAISSEIIQATLQDAIKYTAYYLERLSPIFSAEISLKNTFTKNTELFSDTQDENNYYLPMFGEQEIIPGTTIKQLVPYIKFTVQMTFGCNFEDCIPIYQALLANSKSYVIQEHAEFFNNIVNAVDDIMKTSYTGNSSDVSDENDVDMNDYEPQSIQYFKTFLILLVYRYEIYKKYKEEKKTNPGTLYKYNSYLHIRHDLATLYKLIYETADNDIYYVDILKKYNLLVKKYPQYKSEHIVSFLEHKPDYLLANEIDYSSKIFPVQENDIVLIEFRGFQEEMKELLTVYATAKQRSEIQRNIDECSQNAVGCYSLKNLLEFAYLDLGRLQEQRAIKEATKAAESAAILNAPQVPRTRKLPSYLQDYK